MANGIRTGDPCGFYKGRSSKFRIGSRVRQTPEENRRIYRLKRWGNNNKNKDNSPKTLNDKNHQASSQKFRQLMNQKCQEVPMSTCSRCLPFSWKYSWMHCALLLITCAYSSWVIRGLDGERPVALRSSRVLWASKFLISSKIWLLFRNMLKLEFLHWRNELSVRQWFGRPGFNPRSSHPKGLKNGTGCHLGQHSAL